MSLLYRVNEIQECPGTVAADCSTRSPRSTGPTKQMSLQLPLPGQKQQFPLPVANDGVSKEKFKLNTCKGLAATSPLLKREVSFYTDEFQGML